MLGRKVIYVRCINCSYNSVAKGIRLLDKKAFLFIQEKIHASKGFWRIYPLKCINDCQCMHKTRIVFKSRWVLKKFMKMDLSEIERTSTILKQQSRSNACFHKNKWKVSQSKEDGKDQEWIQSSATPDLGHHMEKRQNRKTTPHTWERAKRSAGDHKSVKNREDSTTKQTQNTNNKTEGMVWGTFSFLFKGVRALRG